MSTCVCRWWAGEWEACSATCGPHGEKKRTVLCIQTMGSDEQALPATDCQHLLKPKTLISCNRDILCPSDWTVGNWSEVSAGSKGKWQLFVLYQPPTHSSSFTTAKRPKAKLHSGQYLSPLAYALHFPCLAYFPFLHGLPLTCPVFRYLPGMSWMLLPQTHDG